MKNATAKETKMNQATIFPLSPDQSRERGSADFGMAHAAIEELTAHFQVKQPGLKRSRTRGGSYTPSRQLIKWGAESFRGIDSLLHEFAHHLQKEARFAAVKPEGRKRITRWGTVRETRSIHGQDFYNALMDVATFAYGDPKHFTWANEYRALAAKYKRETGQTGFNCAPTRRLQTPAPITRLSDLISFGFPPTPTVPVSAAPKAPSTKTTSQKWNDLVKALELAGAPVRKQRGAGWSQNTRELALSYRLGHLIPTGRKA